MVLQHGWAYGSKCTTLSNKIIFQALTGGGDDASYQKEGKNGVTIAELTSPFKAMARLCNMNCLPPYTVLGIHRGISENDINAHAEDYRRTLIALRDETIDLDKVHQYPYINSDLDSVIGRSI